MASCTTILLMLCLFVPCSSIPSTYLSASYFPRRTPKVVPARYNNNVPNPINDAPNYQPFQKPSPPPASYRPPPQTDGYPQDYNPYEKPTERPVSYTPPPQNYGHPQDLPTYRYPQGYEPDQKPNRKPVSYTPAPSTYTPPAKINPTPKTKSSSNNPSSDPYWPPGPDFPPFYNDVPEEPIFDPFEHNPNLNSWYGSDDQFGRAKLPENHKPNSKPVPSTPVSPTYSYSQNNKPDPKPNDKPVSYTPTTSTYDPPVKTNPTPKTNSSSNNPSSDPYWPPGPDFPPFYYDVPEEPIFDPFEHNPNLNSWYGSGVQFESVVLSDNYKPRQSEIHKGRTDKDSRAAGDDDPRVPSNVSPPSSGFGSRPYTSTYTPSYVNPTPPEYSDSRPPAGFVIPSLTVYTEAKPPVYATPTSYVNPSRESGDSKPSGYPNPIPPAGYIIPTPTSYVNPSPPRYSDSKPSGYPNPVPPAGYIIPTPTSYVNPSPPRYSDSKPSGYPNPVPPAGYIIPTPTSYVNPSPPRYSDSKPSGYPNPVPPAGYIIPNPPSYVSYIPSGSENGKLPPSRYADPQLAGYPTAAPSGYENGRPPAGYVTDRPSDYVPPTPSNYPKPTPPGYNNPNPVVGYGGSKQSGYDGSSVSGLGNSNPSPNVVGYDNHKPSGNTNPPSSGYGPQGPSGYEGKKQDVYRQNDDNYDALYLTADDPNYLFILEQYGLEEDPCKQRGKVFTFSSSCSTYFTCENDFNGKSRGIRLNDCGDYFSYDIAQGKCVPDTYCSSGCQNAHHVKPTNNAYKFLNGGYAQDCPLSLYFNFQSCTCDRLAIY